MIFPLLSNILFLGDPKFIVTRLLLAFEMAPMYVYNGNVYVAGREKNSQDKQVAMLWKNGVSTPLATDAFAGGVMVK